MKLRWKYFLVLVAASLVPLLAVTWITQKASRRLGKTISERAQNTLTDTVRQEMVRATRSYAAFSHLGGVTTELGLRVLAAKAELALALPPLPKIWRHRRIIRSAPKAALKPINLSAATTPISFWPRVQLRKT
ncbi:MAG: hypothetical protein WBM69_08315 [Desulfobacterales bacterium]